MTKEQLDAKLIAVIDEALQDMDREQVIHMVAYHAFKLQFAHCLARSLSSSDELLQRLATLAKDVSQTFQE